MSEHPAIVHLRKRYNHLAEKANALRGEGKMGQAILAEERMSEIAALDDELAKLVSLDCLPPAILAAVREIEKMMETDMDNGPGLLANGLDVALDILRRHFAGLVDLQEATDG